MDLSRTFFAQSFGALYTPPGVILSPGYTVLRGKLADGSYIILTGLTVDNSRTNLQGKAAT